MLLKCRFYSQGTAAREISDTTEELDKKAKLQDENYELRTDAIFIRPEVLSRNTRTGTIEPGHVKTDPPNTNTSDKVLVTKFLIIITVLLTCYNSLL